MLDSVLAWMLDWYPRTEPGDIERLQCICVITVCSRHPSYRIQCSKDAVVIMYLFATPISTKYDSSMPRTYRRFKRRNSKTDGMISCVVYVTKR
jgi:hypothetical protein